MKKTLFALLQICLLSCAVFTGLQAQTCTFTNLRLDTQQEVNDFSSACTTIKGDITIGGADITDLSPLKNIETIEGKLTIQNNTILTSLTGLEKLVSTTHLLIYTNDALTDLTGLDGLTSIGNTAHIRYNKSLISLNGLDNLTGAGTLYVSNNDALPNLNGLGSFESVSDLLSITSNKSLTSLSGLTSLTSVARIIIGENELLPDLSGLEALTSVTWQMNVSSNKSMLSFNGLSSLTYLSEAYFSDNNLMTDMSGLETVTGVKWLVIGESKGLTSLNGLHNLMSATNFIIRDNDLLTDLSGLGSLTSIGWLQVSGNPELLSLSGLGPDPDGLRSGANERVSASLAIGGLSMTDNPKLTTCAIASVCSLVSITTVTISGNGAGCESQAAIQVTCGSLPVTLASFTAVPENRTALLQWTTTEESNSAVFEIEHSLNAKTWQKAGEQTAKGESNELVNYQWVHNTPSAGLNYYRLKMIDRAADRINGSYTYSRMASLKFDGLNQAPVSIYPNPVSDVLFVEDKHDIIWLRIVNLQGKTVYETKNVPNDGLPVKKLAAGLYQVHINRQGGVVQTKSVVVL